MTQALINSLNIISEKSVNLSEKVPKTEGMDFGKIFETKKDITVNKNSAETQAEKTPQNSENSNNKKETKSTNQQNDYKTENNADTNAIKQNNLMQKKSQTEETSNTLEQNAEELSAELSLYISKNQDEDEDVSEAEELIAEEVQNITDEIITEEITITDEEPTMYKELTTLENPTTAILLQSQIQKMVVNAVENEQQSNSEESANVSTGTQNLTNYSNSTVFKHVDSNVQKTMNFADFAPKESARIKGEKAQTNNIISENIIKELNVEVISSQSSGTETSTGDFMQNQSPQDHTARIMIQGDIKYESAASEAVKTSVQTKAVDVTPSKIVEQISKQIEGMFNSSKLEIVLNPGSLGKVNLQLVNSKEGLMAQFTVTTQDAKDMLMKGLDGLKESLLAQGVNVDNVSVKLEESEREYNFDWTEQEGSRGGNKQQGTKKQKENEKTFEQMMFNTDNEVNV